MTLIGGASAVLLASAAVARADYTVNVCRQYPNDAFTAFEPSDGGIQLNSSTCPSWLSEQASPNLPAKIGDRGGWQANAPAGLEIVGASVSNGGMSVVANGGLAWGGYAYWQGASAALTRSGSTGGSWSGFASPYFGFELVCLGGVASPTSCQPGDTGSLVISGPASLTVRETVDPTLSASGGLWQTNGWVRGAWPLGFSGGSPSGVCALSGSLNQIPFTGTSSTTSNLATWHQCSAPPVSTTINTAAYGQGPMPLVIVATDAAGNVGQASETVDVDNSVPTLSLSGRADAPSTAGTQFVTATAGGSPSGIAQVVCSVDDGQVLAMYAGASARVPVSGIGEHQVSCTAYNNAVDPNGVHGVSQTQTRLIKIGAPTALAVAFSKFARLRCNNLPAGQVKCHLKRRRVRVLVRVPLKRHGKLVKRNGKVVYRTRVEHQNVLVSPGQLKKRTRHGHATKVSGWLGLTDGTALAGKTVEVLTAPDDGLGTFTPAAEAITAANGTWTVSLPAGPSRLIEAAYPGSATTERSRSGLINLLVRSRVELTSVTPNRVAWGQTVTIKGRLLGGYLPAAGINVRLRIGIANAKTTFGVKEHVSGTGKFSATYTFGPGDPRIHRTYWFQIASLPAGDYPYTPSSSSRINVQVGGHP